MDQYLDRRSTLKSKSFCFWFKSLRVAIIRFLHCNISKKHVLYRSPKRSIFLMTLLHFTKNLQGISKKTCRGFYNFFYNFYANLDKEFVEMFFVCLARRQNSFCTRTDQSSHFGRKSKYVIQRRP